MNFEKFLRTPFFTEHLWWLLLYYAMLFYHSPIHSTKSHYAIFKKILESRRITCYDHCPLPCPRLLDTNIVYPSKRVKFAFAPNNATTFLKSMLVQAVGSHFIVSTHLYSPQGVFRGTIRTALYIEAC